MADNQHVNKVVYGSTVLIDTIKCLHLKTQRMR